MLIDDPRIGHHASRAERRALLRAFVALTVIALVAAAVWLATYRLFLGEVEKTASDTLEFHEATLADHLEKSRFVAPMLARHPVIEIALANPSDTASRSAARALVGAVAAMSGAERVDIWAPGGELITSSLPGPLNPADIPTRSDAFATALQGRLGRALFASPSGGAPSYLFASPVRTHNAVTGVATIRVSLDPIQQAWALSADPLIALVESGRVVLANRSDWSLETDGKLVPPRARERNRYVQVSQAVPLLNAQLHLVSQTNSASARATSTALAVALLLVLLLSGAWITRERRLRLLRQVRAERQMARQLERRVAERTQELTESNAKLAQQIQVREATELQLRQAQDELVQAARLATLGQLSAAISHEFNQPLAAIRSYAENASAFLERERPERAGENLERITALVDRMSELSQHLRLFARQGSADLEPMPLAQAVDGAMLLLEPMLRRSQVRLRIERIEPGPIVRAGAIRLEQVIVNLLSNAVDALEDQPHGCIWLRTEVDSTHAQLIIEDNGPGIDAGVQNSIFDPFVTTKPAGKGVGLGLAIVSKIVRDFGGTIGAEARAGGGARFVVRLPLADGNSKHADNNTTS